MDQGEFVKRSRESTNFRGCVPLGSGSLHDRGLLTTTMWEFAGWCQPSYIVEFGSAQSAHFPSRAAVRARAPQPSSCFRAAAQSSL